MSLSRLIQATLRHFPFPPPDPVLWAEENVILPSSARARHFRCDVTPWIREPLYRAVQGLWLPPENFDYDMSVEARIVTLMKPIQSGGSTFGEVLLLYWIKFARGILQYNWRDDIKAKARWESRIDDLLNACLPVKEKRDSLPANSDNKLEINFGNVFLMMQGAFTPGNLDSDSVPLQLNEEIHDWPPGHLPKARGRSTAVWNFKSCDISNAGKKGDQLDQAYNDGTAQRWMVKCPHCSNPNHEANAVYHQMRTKWEDKKPLLGGLRYDADGARHGFMQYDYNKIRPTIRFQMPCGGIVHNEDMSMRRGMSLGGRYSEPTNLGAELVHRSYTYEAVCVDFINWMDLIKEKHNARRSKKLGDIEPWRRYRCERECIPFDPDEIPADLESITITSGTKKLRIGLEGGISIFSLDRQQGRKTHGEFPHWWLIIRSVLITESGLKSVILFEGKLETDGEAIKTLDDYNCNRWQGVADSGYDTEHVYVFCLKYGINAIKGGKEQFYSHPSQEPGVPGPRRIYSPERPLHEMIGAPPLFEYIQTASGMQPDLREPMFFLYSKIGIRERLNWLRAETDYQVPEDVSDDYKSHQDSEERTTKIHPETGESVVMYVQHKRRNDLYVCECYIAMQIDQGGGISEQSIPKGDIKNEGGQEANP